VVQKHYPLRHVFPTSYGSAALHVAVAALRLQPGDEVIVPPITDMGSVIGILYQQGVPVFADVDPRTYTLDPESVARAITPRRAIMPVHLGADNPIRHGGLGRAVPPARDRRDRGIARKRGARASTTDRSDSPGIWRAIRSMTSNTSAVAMAGSSPPTMMTAAPDSRSRATSATTASAAVVNRRTSLPITNERAAGRSRRRATHEARGAGRGAKPLR
jgi:hypothetical protein